MLKNNSLFRLFVCLFVGRAWKCVCLYLDMLYVYRKDHRKHWLRILRLRKHLFWELKIFTATGYCVLWYYLQLLSCRKYFETNLLPHQPWVVQTVAHHSARDIGLKQVAPEKLFMCWNSRSRNRGSRSNLSRYIKSRRYQSSIVGRLHYGGRFWICISNIVRSLLPS